MTATTINVHGGFLFKIEVGGMVRLVTGDPEHAVAVLTEMGVQGPEALVAHAQTRGSVEIATAED